MQLLIHGRNDIQQYAHQHSNPSKQLGPEIPVSCTKTSHFHYKSKCLVAPSQSTQCLWFGLGLGSEVQWLSQSGSSGSGWCSI